MECCCFRGSVSMCKEIETQRVPPLCPGVPLTGSQTVTSNHPVRSLSGRRELQASHCGGLEVVWDSASFCLCFLPYPELVNLPCFSSEATEGNSDFAEARGAVTHFRRKQGTAQSLRAALHWTQVITERRIQPLSAGPQPVPNEMCSTFQEGDCRPGASAFS